MTKKPSVQLPDGSPQVLSATQEAGLAAFLLARSPQACIVAPSDVLQSLAALGPLRASVASSLEDVPAKVKRLFVHDPLDESGLISRAQAAFPSAEVYGFLNHLVPGLSASDNPLAAGRSDEAPARLRYAVVCPPRTGSTFLCEMLQAAGLGAPREHLRLPLVHALRSPGVDHRIVFETIERLGAVDGIFGTKLISEFLLYTFDRDGLVPALQQLAQCGFRFIHLERELIDQAVSKYLSARSGIWHSRHAAAAQRALAQMEQVPYDAAAMRRHYEQAMSQQSILRDAVERLDSALVLHVDYSDLCDEPLAVLARCGTHLGEAVHPERVRFDGLPVKLASTHAHAQQLRERFATDMGQG